MQFLRDTLSNGLEIVAEVNDEARTSSVGYFVRTGARDESDDVAGVSHFLEHMVFKGTPTRSPEQVNLEFDAMGADYNAYTGEEQTVYYASVLPEYQSQAVELLSDILRPSLRKEDFDTEKKVIIEEIRMYLDQPPFGADDVLRALHYGRHPLSRSVLGTVDSITNLSVDAMREYFDRRYSPTNIILAAAGRIDFDKLCTDAEKWCAKWKPFEAGRDTTRAHGACGRKTIHKAEATQQYVMQISDGPAATDFDRIPAKILTVVLADSSGSRFFWELEDPGHVEQASLSHSDGDGSGAFMGYIACDPEFTADNLRRLADIYASVETDGIRPAELDSAKAKLNSRVVRSGERTQGRMFVVASNWTQRREYRTIADDLESVERTTVADLQAVLKKYPLSKNTTVCVGPLETVE